MRNIAVEYLRVFFMLLIVLLHIMQYGYNEVAIIESRDAMSYLQLPILMLGKLGVPGFVFISGYYGVKLKLNRLVSLWLQTTFYAFVSFMLLCVFSDVEGNILKGIINCGLSLFDGSWWFINDYFYLILLSVFLNEGILRIDKKVYTFVVLLIVFLIFGVMWFNARYSAMSLILFISMYIIGRYLSLFPVEWINRYRWHLFLISVFAMVSFPIITHALEMDDLILKYIITYFNPFLLMCVISLFCICNNCKITGKGNWLTKNVLAVYLVHCSPFGFWLLFEIIFPQLDFNMWYVLGIVQVIFLTSILIEELRKLLFLSLTNNISTFVLRRLDFKEDSI